MDEVSAQYEAYPYPERDPADEAGRLVTGSPSDLLEIDHFLFRGARDWRRPFRALVAGGGTGDGLIQLAQGLATAGCPAEIVYLDMSRSARGIAEARAARRGLEQIRFVTADLRTAPELGSFDYIDCCGVLHHLQEPQAGFDALAAALTPEGGIGLMVYAPYGRTGVYPLQSALATLLAGAEAAEKVALTRKVLGSLPQSNWFVRNPALGDHRASDAGLYDLLLHARDRPVDVCTLLASLQAAGLELVSFTEPARYDPARYLPDTAEFRSRVKALDRETRMAMAEQLAGDLKTHIGYVARTGRTSECMAKPVPEAVPHLTDLPSAALAETLRRRGGMSIDYGGVKHRVDIPRDAAPLVALIGGLSLGQIARQAGLDWFAFSQLWGPVHRGLTGFNRLRYSRLQCV